ncbi:bZIP transcription factor [Vigna angularis]|uniref:BZIP transcription factor n=1 Tax=Phaseolus angularis TaxID=3914 RepID=A0A8T0KUP9_PHAAN|nr:bZIP transcription factor [Vigna angularis]
MRPPPTLNIFPSQPMHAVPPPNSKVSMELPSTHTSGSKRPGSSITKPNPHTELAPSAPEPPKAVKREGNRKGATSSSEQEAPKTPDPKTLRRLAQNREAARKSRLRKKGILMGGNALLGGEQGFPMAMTGISSEAAMFDVEYARWLEEHQRLVCELRGAVQEHLHENELRLYVDSCLAHYDQVMNLKSIVAKTDVFHLVFGMWKTPAERCFMWIGGFRPSELIKEGLLCESIDFYDEGVELGLIPVKPCLSLEFSGWNEKPTKKGKRVIAKCMTRIILGQIEPLTEQQILGICGLQQSTQEAEEALSQGLDALNQSLSDTLTSDSLWCPPNMTNYMGQMAVAMNKLSTLESFARQADNLRHQTIHRLQQLLTTRQAARCLVAISEYFHRLRALSSLWFTRPRQD